MLKALAERMKKMKTKPDYIKLPLTLTFDDWKRLRTSSPVTLRPEDKEAIVNGVLAAVQKFEPVIYLCSQCTSYVNEVDLEREGDGTYCPNCKIYVDLEKNFIYNLHKL